MSALRLIGRLGLGLLLTAVVISARPAVVRADPASPEWAGPIPIAEQQIMASSPSLAFTADGTAHAVWASADGSLLYASRPPGGSWGAAQRVARGDEPSLAVGNDGVLHLLFRAQVFGNYEIYYANARNGQWSLPINISHTSGGRSDQPILLVTPNGQLQGAWRDNAPGYDVIYSAISDGTFWNSQPVPNARGQGPVLAAAPDGTIYLAWQDAAASGQISSFDIFLSQRTPGQSWTLPLNVSDSPLTDSVGVTLVSAADNLAHVAWVEDGQVLYYAFGRGYAWTAPLQRAVGSVIEQPRLAVEGGSILHLAWHQDQGIQATYGLPTASQWQAPSVVAASVDAAFKDVDLAAMPAGGVAVSWVESLAAGPTIIYESVRSPVRVQQVWLPLLGR